MSKKKGKGSEERKFWYHGKGIVAKVDEYDSPIKGEPNTLITFHDNETGVLHRIRFLDEAGKAKIDFDRGYPMSREPDDHAHDWQNGKRKRQRLLTPKERKYFNKKKHKLKKRSGRF